MTKDIKLFVAMMIVGTASLLGTKTYQVNKNEISKYFSNNSSLKEQANNKKEICLGTASSEFNLDNLLKDGISVTEMKKNIEYTLPAFATIPDLDFNRIIIGSNLSLRKQHKDVFENPFKNTINANYSFLQKSPADYIAHQNKRIHKAHKNKIKESLNFSLKKNSFSSENAISFSPALHR